MLRRFVGSSRSLGLIIAASWACLAGAAGSSPASARDGDDAPPAAKVDVLEGKGLRLVGTTYVLDDEEAVKKKAADLRRLNRELTALRYKQAATETPEAHQAYLQNLNDQLGQLKGEVQMARHQANQIPRFRGRAYGYYSQAQHAEINAYINQLNQEINGTTQALNQAKSHPPDPKLKKKVDSDLLASQTEHDQALEELSRLVHATKDRYAELAKDKAVTKAIKAAEAKVKPSPRLGPSHEFQEIAKQLDKLEKDHARGAARGRSRGRPSRGSGLDLQ
ncbi:hypothetical protein OJF2_33810 [Aquisphaera giovannonii]|uniref:Chromosome partition protein Smc n=1 Tax=Aquisphaera giovannonii TaxID=406548 RepID=A0A5B9W2M0_9BACT|nr:hypothetical protein [Aquisphaera giovannonii]QEH34836.1 hypothetical protein OJF2_33810 [Aquisphaera giovannonii]